MPNFTIDQLRSIMDLTDNIRNMSVIAHVDHGKSTLTDSLVSKAGIIASSKAGEARFTDTRADEQERCITIKSTGISMYFEYDLRRERLIEDAGVAAYKFEKATAALEDAKKKDDAAAIAAAEEKAAEAEAEKAAADAAAARAIAASTVPEEGAATGGAAAAAEGEEEEAEGVEINEHSFLINLIDSPGHVDFSSEVTAALRVTDGALVVVDCIEGVCVQTETVLRQALQERVKPVLMLNKLDRVILELHLDPTEAYMGFQRAIESVNVIISTYHDEALGDVQVRPEQGTVAMGSGLHQWGFTLQKFAKLYAEKMGMSRFRMRRRLWGNNFLVTTKDKKGKKKSSWKTKNEDGSAKHGFVQFIMEPIAQLAEAIMTDKTEKTAKMLTKIGVTLKPDERTLREKPLLKRVMQKWLPAGDTVLEMIVTHLPSPRVAQAYRTQMLYEGPLDDECAVAMSKCDPDGPLMMYVSKMVPTSDKGRFYAFGRVFSGRIGTGQKVRIMGPNYVPGKKTELWVKNIQRTIIMMGRTVEQVADIPAGNTCGLVGVDQYLLKSGTISTSETAHNITQLKFSVSPVVRVAVQPKNSGDLPKLVEGLQRLAKSDPLVQIITDRESGENIIAGAGELHLEICIKDLRDDFMGGAPIIVSEPVVSYRETIQAEGREVMSKSPNKHNRLHMTARNMSDALQVEIEDGKVVPAPKDAKAQARYIVEHFAEDFTDPDEVGPKKMWGFGPDGTGANMLVDGTRAVQYLNEIRESVNGGFQLATQAGPLCDEPVRGGVFRLLDATLHADAIHRGMGQILPTSRRAVFAAMYTASPTLMEPFFLAEITCPTDAAGPIYSVMTSRRGRVEYEVPKEGTPITIYKTFVPVSESFGLDAALREATGGKAFTQCAFDHWEVMTGDPFEGEGSTIYTTVRKVRERKGNKPEPAAISAYEDKM